MQDTESQTPRDPVSLRIVKVLIVIALGVIALSFTVFFLRFTNEVSRKATAPEAAPVEASDTAASDGAASGTTSRPSITAE